MAEKYMIDFHAQRPIPVKISKELFPIRRSYYEYNRSEADRLYDLGNSFCIACECYRGNHSLGPSWEELEQYLLIVKQLKYKFNKNL